MNEVDILARVHALFGGYPDDSTVGPDDRTVGGFAALTPTASGRFADAYRDAAETSRVALAHTRQTDRELAAILAAAVGHHREAHRATGAVLAAARNDPGLVDSPIAAREVLRRRLIRLRTQKAHLLAAQRRSRRGHAALRALGYGTATGADRAGAPDSRARVAVQAALGRLGCPYVWGAAGPDRFDCSGLVKWAYEQSGIRLHRTTYDQINDGIAIPRSQIQPGDLVFPHAGHVQLAIGDDLVVEAPHAGANVQISRLGDSIAIRRPG